MHYRWTALHLSCLLLVSATAWGEDIKPGLPRHPPEDRFRFVGGPAPERDIGYSTHLGETLLVRGEVVARHASFVPEYLSQGRSLGPDVSIVFPDLRRGDVFSVCGQLYRVREIGGTKREPVARCELVPEKERPKGVSVRRDSFVIPLARSGEPCGNARLHDAQFTVASITASAGGKPATAKVVLGGPGSKSREVTEATVKAGDVLLIHGNGHAVRAVVPADPKTRIIGWLELSPDPVPEDDLEKAKKPFVRPERPKM